ncbi:MAG: TIR domain-containing protein [Syntrophomonas sp.]
MSKIINLFVSHYGGDEEHIQGFKNLLSNKNYDIRDSSIVESDPNNAKSPDYIKTLLSSQIKWAGTVVVLIGPKTHERDWVNWEIEYAAKHGDKRIVGVFLRGATDADIPEKLDEYGDACVTWNSDKIMAAIEGKTIWETSTGQTRSSEGSPRSTC